MTKSHACNLIGSPGSWTVESANTRNDSKCARPFPSFWGWGLGTRLFRAKRGSHSGPGDTCMVSRISKISLSVSRVSQASLCSLSTVDQIANLLPSVTKPCNASSCPSVCTPFEKLCASLKARTPLSQL